MNTLSLFNGMGCVWLALEEAGIKVGKRYSSEIEKFPNQANDALYPDTIQLGDVRNVDVSKLEPITFLAGGSPCQSFSFAGKRKGMATKCEIEILSLGHYLELKEQNFEFEGQSYLFWEYIRILTDIRKYNPDVKFLLENVIMGAKWQKVITQAIGINPIRINAALVSAQNRDRLFWTNIYTEQDGLFGDLKCMIPQPKDQGILLKDVLETDVADKYFLSGKMLDYLNSRKANYNNGKINYKTENDVASCINASSGAIEISDKIIIDTNRKARCFTAGGNSGGLHSQMDLIQVGSIKFGRTEEAKTIRKENMAKGFDTTPFQAKEITGVDYEKMGALTTSLSKDNLLILASRGRKDVEGKWVQEFEENSTGKTNTLTSVQKDNLIFTKNYVPLDVSGKGYKSQQDRAHYDDGKSGCIPSSRTENKMNVLIQNKTIRRLTPRECGRLQSIPEDKLEILLNCGISDSQLYKAFGNGWNIKVISHILQYLKTSNNN